jgi:hypothetical protein
MQRVYYAGAEFFMADAAAEALLDFAALIAGAGKSQRIELPVVDELGEPAIMRAIVGPASQIIARDAQSTSPDPGSDAFVADLEARSKEYRSATAVIGGHATGTWDELE